MKHEGTIILLVGPPLSGKSKVVGAALRQEFGCEIFSTSEKIREHRPDQIPIMASGGVVTDEVLEDLFWNHFPLSGECLAVDCPRSAKQVAWFAKNRPNHRLVTIFTTLSEEKIRERLGGKDREGRPDDNLDILKVRLRLYREYSPETLPALKRHSWRFVEIDASAPPNEVRRQAVQACEAFGFSRSLISA